MKNKKSFIVLSLSLILIFSACGGGSGGGGAVGGGGGGGATGTDATERMSISSSGSQGNGTSSSAGISSDGRFVAFASSATNLVTSDTNGVTDIFIHDRDTDADGTFDEAGADSTTRVSVSSAGAQGNNSSSNPSISSDGRFVVFESSAINLVSGDTNGVTDVFVHDRDTDADGTFDEAGAVSTTRVSVSSAGVQGNNSSSNPSISSDGRFVAFESSAINLVSGDTNGVTDVFVHDRDTDADGTFDEPGAVSTIRISVSSAGTQGNTSSSNPSISSDGRFVAFESSAINLVSGDTNGVTDIFVHDRDTDADGIFDESGAISTSRMSASSAGTQGNNDSSAPSISSSGRFVTFESDSINLASDDTNSATDIFVRDRDTDEDGTFDESGAVSTTRISVSSSDTQGNNASSTPSISSDGKFVAFESAATNLVTGDSNGETDIFVRDRDADSGSLGG